MLKDIWKKTWAWALILLALGFAVKSNLSVAINNYQTNKQVQAEQTLVNQMTIQNEEQALLNDYYSSPSYQDVAARSQLDMELPGETAYVVKGFSNSDTMLNNNLNAIFPQESSSQTATTTNFTKWLNYFKGKQ